MNFSRGMSGLYCAKRAYPLPRHSVDFGSVFIPHEIGPLIAVPGAEETENDVAHGV